MADDDVRFESIADTADDELDPYEANRLDDSLRSAGDKDDRTPYESVEDENN